MKALMFAAVLTACAGPVLACSCAPRPANGPGPELLVTAEVIRVDPATRPSGHVATLRVLAHHAGQSARTIRVETSRHTAACGVAFQPGERRQYALYRRDGHYSTNACYMFHHAKR